MSIHNMVNKIKSKIDIDKSTVLFLFIIIGVGISSFGLGRLSAQNISQIKDSSNFMEVYDTTTSQNPNSSILPIDQPSLSKEKKYVASKNGKMYYSIGCSGAKRINPENEVWFESTADAEKSGFTLSSSCK